jgi:hypothetical protein
MHPRRSCTPSHSSYSYRRHSKSRPLIERRAKHAVIPKVSIEAVLMLPQNAKLANGSDVHESWADGITAISTTSVFKWAHLPLFSTLLAHPSPVIYIIIVVGILAFRHQHCLRVNNHQCITFGRSKTNGPPSGIRDTN